jgi:hypothetical protein
MSLKLSGFLSIIPDAIPISDTLYAKTLRITAAEAWIANYLTRYIFYALFPWPRSENEQLNILDRILDDFLRNNPQKEAILRAIISTSEFKDRESRQTLAISNIIKEVKAKCAPILALKQDRSSTFEVELTKVIHTAIDIWKDAQKSRLRTVATFRLEEGIFDWDEMDEPASKETTSSTSGGSSAKAVTALFPQIYQISITEGNVIIHNGVGLWSDHAVYQLGVDECKEQSRRNSSVPGIMAERVRKIL